MTAAIYIYWLRVHARIHSWLYGMFVNRHDYHQLKCQRPNELHQCCSIKIRTLDSIATHSNFLKLWIFNCSVRMYQKSKMYYKAFLVLVLLHVCQTIQSDNIEDFSQTDLHALKGELSKTLTLNEAEKTANVYAKMMSDNNKIVDDGQVSRLSTQADLISPRPNYNNFIIFLCRNNICICLRLMHTHCIGQWKNYSPIGRHLSNSNGNNESGVFSCNIALCGPWK